MKLIKTVLSLLSIAFLLYSCNGNEQRNIEKLQADVIEIHDEVMPKMDQIMKLQKRLKSVKADTAQVLPSDKLLLVDNMIVNLEKASESMMNWMRNYDSMMAGLTEEEKLAYLKSQEIAIKQVKQEMLSTISEASVFLKSTAE